MSTAPTPSKRQQDMLHRIAGLPYVTLVSDSLRFVGELSTGERVRAGQLEEVFNAALIIEAMEGQGSAARGTLGDGIADKVHAELVAMAEKHFGVTIENALAIYLGMERTTYGTWEDRPRVKWPRPVAN